MKPIKVGIVANEFFDPKVNRVGGFGWAARRAVEVFRSDRRFAEPVCFAGERIRNERSLDIDGTKVLLPTSSPYADLWAAWKEGIDVLLTIDFRTSYTRWLNVLPLSPVIVWVRDPRTPSDHERIRTLRIPGIEKPPQDTLSHHLTSLARAASRRPYLRRRIVLANKMAYMRAKNTSVYGLPPSDLVLPNPDLVDYPAVRIKKAPRPTIISLGRLDPVKRPWLFVELARHFPEADFLMLGKHFINEPGGWQPGRLPDNLRMLGNVSGQPKLDILSSAWVLVNTSIHEESAVSLMEALAHEVPVISFIESDGISARFGRCVGYDTGTGLQSVPRLVEALRELLENHEEREQLGRAGRRWVMAEHNTTNFVNSFLEIALSVGVKKAGALMGPRHEQD